MSPVPEAVVDLGRRAKVASRVLATASTASKNEALAAAAALIEVRRDEILAANAVDLAAAEAAGLDATPLDRLRLTDARIASMAKGLRDIVGLPDPVGEVVDGWRRPNGLEIQRVRMPLGVIAIIYENRPNVTSDAAGLCLKSGNAALLRGSTSALRSNVAIASAMRAGLGSCGLPEDGVILVEDTSYETATSVMRLSGYVDCLIPRGGPSLIRSILDNATVPFVIDGDGNCHVYVDASADIDQAVAIVVNAKTQRPSVCNAAETLVVHETIAPAFIAAVCPALEERGVTLVGDDTARHLWPTMTAATEADWETEYLSLTLAVRVVPSLEAAIEHVNRYSTGNTEAILTSDLRAARRFVAAVDSGTVVVNASTRFNDGGEFGYGAEIGISTQKLHARGPMALRELTATKNVVWGDGQTRT